MTIFTIFFLITFLVAVVILLFKVHNDKNRLQITISSLQTTLSEREKLLVEKENALRAHETTIAQINAGHKDELDRMAESLRSADQQRARLEERLQYLEQMRQQAERQRAEEQRQAAIDREQERIRLEQQSEQRFENLARRILESNTDHFKKQSTEGLNNILNPLKDELERFKRSVDEAYSNEARERFALGERIKELVQLNETIGREAKDLTRALRGDSKVQGDWGEMILETILEKSGLKKGVHFDLQVTTDENGNVIKDTQGHMLRPDAVIYYPDGRCVIVDSKVSLTSYVDLINSEPASTEYNTASQGHLRSVKLHIKELATKNYQDFIGNKRADFVTMFIPNEGAYMAAMNLDPQLWQEAYDQRVLIVSPTHLLSFLRLAEQMWRQDDMKRNVIEIADESGKMYDKFAAFVSDMTKIEKGLTATRTAYDDAMNKLSTGKGNLVRRAEKLRSMGARTTKSIDPTLTGPALDE
ncbi:MAG: DNA recombination protein RmuC [Clostridiales bacterium]|nr:DNA recombination protein RmuC [Clostridiales bacterium]